MAPKTRESEIFERKSAYVTCAGIVAALLLCATLVFLESCLGVRP